MSGGERFWVHTPKGRLEMPGTTKPTAISYTATSSNLVRARGYRRVYDLADRLPDPVPIIWTGFLSAETEAELRLLEAELRQLIRAATAFDREDEDDPTIVQSSSVIFVPSADSSNESAFTVTWIPLNVPDPDK